MKLTFNQFSKQLKIQHKPLSNLHFTELYKRIFTINPHYLTFLFETPNDVLNLRDVLKIKDAILPSKELFFLGLCYIAAGEKDEGVSYLERAANNDYNLALTALGEYYLQTNETEKGIGYFKKATTKNLFVKHHLGRHYLFGLNGVKQNNKKALKHFQSLDGLSFTTNDPQAPSTNFCMHLAEMNICMKRIKLLIEPQPATTKNEKSNSLLNTLHNTLQLKLTAFEKNMTNLGASVGMQSSTTSCGNEAKNPIYPHDEKTLYKKREEALNNFKEECRNEINKTIKLLDKDDLRAVDYLLNLIKAIINVGVRVLNLCGLANKNSFFPYVHAKPAEQLLPLKESLLKESLYRG